MNFELSSRFQNLEELKHFYGKEGLKLDLGCGFYKPSGFIGLDFHIPAGTQVEDSGNAPDILLDLNNEQLPFEDGAVTEIRSSHFLEHSNLDHIIDESYRVLRATGIFQFSVPYASSPEGLYPGHQIFLTEKWFKENLNFQKKFKILSLEYSPTDDWSALPFFLKALIPFSFARLFLFNVCKQMTLVCAVRKQ